MLRRYGYDVDESGDGKATDRGEGKGTMEEESLLFLFEFYIHQPCTQRIMETRKREITHRLGPSRSG